MHTESVAAELSPAFKMGQFMRKPSAHGDLHALLLSCLMPATAA
jgi:hypothetical protein